MERLAYSLPSLLNSEFSHLKDFPLWACLNLCKENFLCRLKVSVHSYYLCKGIYGNIPLLRIRISELWATIFFIISWNFLSNWTGVFLLQNRWLYTVRTSKVSLRQVLCQHTLLYSLKKYGSTRKGDCKRFEYFLWVMRLSLPPNWLSIYNLLHKYIRTILTLLLAVFFSSIP